MRDNNIPFAKSSPKKSPKKGMPLKSKSKPNLPTPGMKSSLKKITYNQYDDLNGSLEMAHELSTFKEISTSNLSPTKRLSKNKVQLYQSPYRKKLEQGMRLDSVEDIKESKSNCLIY